MMSYLYIGGVEGFGCFTQVHSTGCMDLTSEDDCSLLMATSCSTDTGVPEGATCDYINGGSGWLQHGIEPVSDESSCLNFYETNRNSDITFCPLKECCGTLKNVRICYEVTTADPLIVSYAGALHAMCTLTYNAISKMYLSGRIKSRALDDKNEDIPGSTAVRSDSLEDV